MARHRSRSYSPRRRSRTPPPRDRKHHDDDRRRDLRSAGPTGLLVRNLPLNSRPDDVRIPFERCGPVRDVYLPRDFNTGKPRGFGFVKFRHSDDAAEAKQKMNNSMIGGREIRVVYAEENRKTPHEMRAISGPRHYKGSYSRRTPSRSPRRRYHSPSRSPSPLRHRRYRDDDRSPTQSRSISRSPRHKHKRSHSRSPSPSANGRTQAQVKECSPSMSTSPMGTVQTPSRSRSRSYSPR